MIKSLQSWRFIFALMIFLHHFPVDGVGLFRAGGTCGVSFFLILSGFVMSAGYAEKVERKEFSYGNYFKKRLTRIYPLHFLCLLAAAAILVAAGTFGIKDGAIFCINAALMQSWIPLSGVYFSFNSVSWCLSDLLFFYMVFPPLSRFFNRAGNKKTAAMTGAALILYFIVLAAIPEKLSHPLLYISPVFRLLDFAIGMLLYNLYKSLLDSGSGIMNSLRQVPVSVKSVAELIPVAVLALCILLFPAVPEKLTYASYWWVPSCLIILTYAINSQIGGGILTRILQNRALVYLGNISFSFYMVHQLGIRILGAVTERVDMEMPWQILMALSLAVILVGSIAANRLYEKPVAAYLNRKLIRQ